MFFFFFNDTATTEIYTLSLHDALPICRPRRGRRPTSTGSTRRSCSSAPATPWPCTTWPTTTCSCTPTTCARSEEHTSELQSRQYLVCRLLLEKKRKQRIPSSAPTYTLS